jgi:hypothetical protein
LKGTIEVDIALFDQHNAWFGNPIPNIGAQTKSWQESYIRPGIEGKYLFCDKQTFYGRFDVVQVNTFGGYDADATNLTFGKDVSNFHWQDTYLGWKSGELITGLDPDFLDISFGRQRYKVGDGFLFWNEGGAGFFRAGYWMGMQTDADYAGVIRMRQGPWSVDLVYLKADDMKGFNFSQSNTRLYGITADYTAPSKTWNIGGGVYSVESDLTTGHYAQDMTVFDARAGIKPFANCASLCWLQPLEFKGEFVYDDKSDSLQNGNAWNVSVSYPFANIPWKPVLSYRFADFSTNYDSLFYGLSDWGSWYQGEVMGEYVNGNHNLVTNMVELQFFPCEPLRVSVIYYHISVGNKAAAGLTSSSLADEVDLIFDYTYNKHLSFSLVGAEAMPDSGGIQLYGGSNNWEYVMLLTTLKF